MPLMLLKGQLAQIKKMHERGTKLFEESKATTRACHFRLVFYV